MREQYKNLRDFFFWKVRTIELLVGQSYQHYAHESELASVSLSAFLLNLRCSPRRVYQTKVDPRIVQYNLLETTLEKTCN